MRFSELRFSQLFAGAAIALATFSGAHATTVSLTNDSWQLLDVVDPAFGLGNSSFGWIDINDGSDLSFTFTVGVGQTGYLTVVDGGFSGDEFSVSVNGAALAGTSAAMNSYPDSIGFDFDAALADADFSRGSYVFSEGFYTVTGALSRSALDDSGTEINATVGAVKLQVIPEPSSFALLLAAGGALTLAGRRRCV